MSWAAGARAVLRCQSPRMVWTQDRLHDRQRVVHWDLSGPFGPARRLVDMYSAGEQRVYEPRDRGRLLLSPSAFQDGNFSLLIRGTGLPPGGSSWRGSRRGVPGGGAGSSRRGSRRGARAGAGGRSRRVSARCTAVEETDEGLYTCSLHHHYCHLYENLAIRLQVTDNRECAGPAQRPPPPAAAGPAPPAALAPPPSRLSPHPQLSDLRPQPGPPARTGTARRRCWWWRAARPRS